MTMRLAQEKERMMKLSDQEIIKEFLSLGKEFSALQIKLSKAREDMAMRKQQKKLAEEKLLEEFDEDMDTTEEEDSIKGFRRGSGISNQESRGQDCQ